MKTINVLILHIFLALLMVIPVYAQESDNDIKSQFDQQFSYASRILQLAEAMPADTYSWRPMEGVSSVGEVYLHIAQYNFSTMGALGISPPEGVDLESINSITGKEEIVEILGQSIEFVTSEVQNLPNSKLAEMTEMYGRPVTGQAVLVMMLTHMSEHVGQSIAYARMNEVVPPWSQ